MKKFYIISCFFLIFTTISIAQNIPPTAVNDTAATLRGYIKLNVRSNDFDVEGNPFYVFIIYGTGPKHGIAKRLNDSIIEYSANPSFTGLDSFSYKIREYSSPQMWSIGKVCLTVDNSYTIDSIDINNINAGFMANGNLFWERNPLSNYSSNWINHFEVPKGSKKSTIFNGQLWIGGKDSQDSLHFAGQMYNQLGYDFWAGPVSNVYDSIYDVNWNRVWKIKKSEIDYHLAHCWSPGYIPSQVLLDWPGNGDVSQGQLAITAPFKDWNSDGIYNPWAGDFPLIKGDEAVYFIINDDRYLHTESLGKKLKVEVHGMAYSFDCKSDLALWNTVFLNYKIYNRSLDIYDSTFIATYIDFDNGNPNDDYIRCDVQRGAFYAYNGQNLDGNGGLGTYGANPPAQAVVFLAGAKIDNDGIDNPAGLCDDGVNGFNFGNGIVDDERYGLSRFMYFTGVSPTVISDPDIATDYFNNMNGKWKDSSPIMWGGNGNPLFGSCGPKSKFMFPGNSDTCHWGTNGLFPNCDSLWTEETVFNLPADKRGLGSTGFFTFNPGDIQELDLAFVFGRDFLNPNATAAITTLEQSIDNIIYYFRNDSTPCSGIFTSIDNPNQPSLQINVFPNPSAGIFTIQQNNSNSQKYSLSVRNIQGQLMLSEKVEFEKTIQLDISKFAKGIYFLSLQSEKEQIVKKLIKN
ncbi:MAG: T9SS type A sorting domain-containing protein [Bacteroidetes bacterium]|nr:T9SS type A sorting domain-containing protein [Bacteroidota bacterium]